MAEWKKVIVSGSNAELNNIFVSGNITGSNISSSGNLFASLSITDNVGYKTVVVDPITGKFYRTGSYGGGGGDSFFEEYITTAGSESLTTIDPSNLSITGASALLAAPSYIQGIATQSTNNYALVVSQSAYFYNHNVGYPTSNAWKSSLNGSYFNNFTANTDVSEILRFIAGLLSSSAPDASPNTKTYSGLVINSGSFGTSSSLGFGFIPQDFESISSNQDIIYLANQSLTGDGYSLFPGLTIYTQSAFNLSFSSTASGTTSVSSSIDPLLFGLGTTVNSVTPTTLYVSGGVNFVYTSASSTLSTSLTKKSLPTATSRSISTLSSNTNGFDTTTGIKLGIIQTINPTVIPPSYQDGRFISSFTSSIFDASNNNIATSSRTSVSSSGWYEISASIAINSGSVPQPGVSYYTTQSLIFWAPLGNISLPSQTITFTNIGSGSIGAISNSLSGAPYLVSASYRISMSVNGLFNPTYTGSTLFSSSITSGFISTSIVHTTDSRPVTGSTNVQLNQGVATSQATINSVNRIYSTAGTLRSVGSVPFYNDIGVISGSINLSVNGGTNIGAISISPTTFTVGTTGSSGRGTRFTRDNVFNYHDAGAFGQPSSSGSMAFHNPVFSTSTNAVENFQDESRRVQLNGTNRDSNAASMNLLTAANVFNSSSRLVNAAPRALQVKPGYLIAPGAATSGRAYWYGSDYYDTNNYYWYIREFNTGTSTTINSFTLTFNNINSTNDVVNWDSTANNKIALGLVMSSSFSTLFDINQNVENIGIGLTSTDSIKNPFTTTINIVGNNGSSKTAGDNPVYTILVNAGQGMTLNATYPKFYLVIRYRGDATPITKITYSS
jgi:hypothetical protein